MAVWSLVTILLLAGVGPISGNYFSASSMILDLVLPDRQNDDENTNLQDVHVQADDVEELKRYYDVLTQETLQAVSEAQNTPSRGGSGKRSRRSVLYGQPMTDEHGVHRLYNVEPLFPMCDHAINIKFLDFENETYAVCVSATTLVTLGKISAKGWSPVASWEVRQPRQAALFADRGLIYIVATDSDNADGTELLMYSKATNNVFLDHTIHSRQATAVAVWAMEPEGGKYHLAIANSPGPESEEFHDSTYLYEWKGTYFDKYSTFRSYDVHDLEPFHIHSNVFLAVANHRVSLTNYHIDSEIYKYDINKKKWKSFQRIRTYAASDWEFFSLGQNNDKEFFLVVANQFDYVHGYRKYDINSVIYKYVENKFVPYQCLQTSGATHVASLRGPNQEFILAISNYFEAVQLYQYNGWKFVLSSVQYTQGSMGPGAVSLAAHYLEDSKVALAVSNPVLEHEDNLYALSFQHENKLQNWYRQSVSWCKSAKHKAESIPTPLILKNLSALPRIDQEEPIHLHGDLIFDNNAALSGSLQTPQLQDVATGSVFDHSVLHRLEELNGRLLNINNKIRQMKEYLSGALRLSGDQVITGEYSFHSGTFTCESGNGCNIVSVHTNYLNEDNVEGLLNKVILTHGNNEVPLPLEFESIIANDVTVGGLLSGINTSHIVTRSGTHLLRAPTVFASNVQAQTVEVAGLVDGVLISPDKVLLDHGDQMITGDLLFNSIGTENLQVEQRINQVPLNDFYNDVVLDGEKRKIQGPKIIIGDVVVDDLLMHPGAKINNLDLADLWSNVLWKNGLQEVYAPMNFTFLHVDTPQANSINGLAIPGPDVALINGVSEIRGVKTFQKTSPISRLVVLGSLNGLQVIHDTTSGWPNQLDMMVKNADQTVFGHKTFPSLHLDGHSSVSGLVNGVDIRQLAANIVKMNATQELPGSWIFNKAEFHGPLEVMGQIEGLNLAELFHIALKLSQPLPHQATVIFKGLAQIGRLNCPKINGIHIPSDLVMKDGNEVIRGMKIFADAFVAGDVKLRGFANGIDLAFLHDCMLTHGDQVFLEAKTIANDLVVSDVMVGGLINGIPFSSFVSLNRDEVFFGTPMLENPVVHKSLQALSLQFTGRCNNATFLDLVHDTMTFSGPQDVLGHKSILGNLTMLEGSNLETSNINGIDLRLLAADAVYRNLPQTITGRKTFRGLVHFDHLNFFGSLDGVTSWDMMHNWMLQDVPQVIVGDLIVNGDVFVNSFLTSGLINGLDLGYLNNSIVKVNEPAELNGPIHIKEAVVEKGLSLTGNIQGFDLSEAAVLRSQENVISGHKHYANGMEVAGNLAVKGYVDGLKVSELCEHAVRRFGDQHLKSLTVNGNLNVKGGLNVGGLIDGVDLVLLNATALKLDGAIANDHPVAFDSVHVEGPLTLHGLISGMELSHLMDSYMSLSRDQDVNGAMSFQSPVVVKGPLSAGSLATSDGLLNGVDLHVLSNSVLRTIGDQMITAKYVFEEGLTFHQDLHAKKIAGLSVPDDLMMKGRPNVLLGPIAFAQDVNVQGNLHLANGVTLQNVDVTEWAKNAVYKQGNFNITGNKAFESCAVDNARLYGPINGIAISPESVLLTSGDQEIQGNTHFGKGLNIDSNILVGGLVNGIDLDLFQRDAVTRDEGNVISGLKSFAAPVTMDHLVVNGDISGVNLTDLNQKMVTPNSLEGIRTGIQRLQGQVTEMGELLKEQAVTLVYYELAQELKPLQVRTWYYLPISPEIELLLVSDAVKDKSGCTSIHVLQYSYPTGYFVPYSTQLTLPASHAVNIKTVVMKDEILLFVANSNPVSCIRHELGALHVFKWNSQAFDLMQTIEEYPIKDITALELSGEVCVAAVITNPLESQPVHIYCSRKPGFQLVQKLPSSAVHHVSSMICNNIRLLAVTTEHSMDIYIWDDDKLLSSPFTLFQRTAGTSVQLASASQLGHCYLATAAQQLVSTYRYEEPIQTFVLTQKWELDDNVLDLQWIHLPSSKPQLFLVILTRGTRDNLKVYRWQGTSGFVPHVQLTSLDATNIYAFLRPGSVEHFLALIYESCPNEFWHQAGPRGLLLKSKVKGGRYS